MTISVFGPIVTRSVQRRRGPLAEGEDDRGEQQQPGHDDVEQPRRRRHQQQAAGKAAGEGDRGKRPAC